MDDWKKQAPLYSHNMLLVWGAGEAWDIAKKLIVFVASGDGQNHSRVWWTFNRDVRQRSDLLFIAASFWFEESPCAVRTNTASLDRLCTCFVLSTLLVLSTYMLFYSVRLFYVARSTAAMKHVGVILGMPTQIG